ncbi:MAG: type IV secretory system conjugative DNA transfer family protein [Bacteroidota bacterium]
MKSIYDRQDITPIGVTNWRNENTPFGIMDNDRLNHIYVIGKSGTGKSTLLVTMALSDIRKGKGLAVIDPHGDVSQTLLKQIPENRKQDVVYVNPGNPNHIVPFNPLKAVHPNYHHLVASGIIGTFKKIWVDSWGPRMEHILRYSLLTLLNYPNATLLDIQPLLTNQEFREHVLSYKQSVQVTTFWEKEFGVLSPKLRNEFIAPILNKMGILGASEPLKQTIGNRDTSMRIGQIMDKQKILIVNLSKGTLGEDTSTILGSILVTAIQLAALYRATIPEYQRISFYLYIDEAHSFITESITGILAEARKYKLSLFLAHQYIDQLTEPIRKAVFGNVGTLISFRVGATDAEYLAREFYPTFTEEDFINLPRYHMLLKLCIDGEMSVGFSGVSETCKM